MKKMSAKSLTHDARTDDQIITSLQSYTPPTSSERNIWAFWDTGLTNSPPWCQRNVISWVRRLGPTWTVRVLDMVNGSPNHYSKFISADQYPEALNNGTMEGAHLGQIRSDLIRLPLLYHYGGVWLDVGFFLFRSMDTLCWNALEDPTTPYEMAGFAITFTAECGMMFNGFIAARKHNVCIKYWHEIFLKLWEGAKNTAGMNSNPLLKHLPKYEPPELAGRQPPFRYAQFMDYIVQVFCLERLRHVVDTGIGWDGPVYFSEKVLLFDCVKECYWAQRITNWDGRKQFEMLAAPKEDTEHDERWKEAEAFVEAILQTSSTMKVSHGLAIPGREYLSEIWDAKENWNRDIIKGSWGEYLRWAGIHYEHDGELVKVLLPTWEHAVISGGITEVIGTPRSD